MTQNDINPFIMSKGFWACSCGVILNVSLLSKLIFADVISACEIDIETKSWSRCNLIWLQFVVKTILLITGIHVCVIADLIYYCHATTCVYYHRRHSFFNKSHQTFRLTMINLFNARCRNVIIQDIILTLLCSIM